MVLDHILVGQNNNLDYCFDQGDGGLPPVAMKKRPEFVLGIFDRNIPRLTDRNNPIAYWFSTHLTVNENSFIS